MKLRSRRLERAIRRLIRRERRASPALRAACKAHKRPATSGDWLVVPFLYLLEALILFEQLGEGEAAIIGATSQELVRGVLAAVALQAMGLAFLRARQLRWGLYGSEERAVLAQYPVSDEAFFWFQWRKVLRASLCSLSLFLVIYTGITVTGRHWGGADLLVAGGLAVLQWAVTIALGVLLAQQFPRVPHGLVGGGLVVAAIVLAFSPGSHSWLALACAQTAAVTPAGWITHGLNGAVLGGNAGALLAVLPVAIVLVPAPWILRRMSATYSTAERDLLPETATGEGAVEERIAREVRERTGRGLEQVEDAEFEAQLEDAADARLRASAARKVLAGAFLTGMDWQRLGPIERLVGHCLSPRERTASEFMVGGAPIWSARWKVATAIVGVAAAVMWLWPAAPQWAMVWPGVVATLIAVPVLGGGWAALDRVQFGGQHSPLYALFPITYGEMASVACVTNAIRCVAWLPVAAGYCALCAPAFGGEPMDGALVAARGIAVAIAAQPLLLAWRVTWQGDSHVSLSFRRMCAALPPLVGSTGFIAGAVVFALPLGVPVAIGVGAMVVTSLGVCLLYGWLHNRCRIDLVLSTLP